MRRSPSCAPAAGDAWGFPDAPPLAAFCGTFVGPCLPRDRHKANAPPMGLLSVLFWTAIWWAGGASQQIRILGQSGFNGNINDLYAPTGLLINGRPAYKGVANSMYLLWAPSYIEGASWVFRTDLAVGSSSGVQGYNVEDQATPDLLTGSWTVWNENAWVSPQTLSLENKPAPTRNDPELAF